jgi:succinate dehydrogenase / fumarate reductase membrane anchor subunit
MTMRTPLGKAIGLGTAKSGTEHFWRQRLTAVSNIPSIVFIVAFIVSHVGASRAEMLASFKNPLVALMAILALTSIAYHMRLGMQVIVEDYVHGAVAKPALVILNTFYAAIVAVIGIYAVLTMSVSG